MSSIPTNQWSNREIQLILSFPLRWNERDRTHRNLIMCAFVKFREVSSPTSHTVHMQFHEQDRSSHKRLYHLPPKPLFIVLPILREILRFSLDLHALNITWQIRVYASVPSFPKRILTLRSGIYNFKNCTTCKARTGWSKLARGCITGCEWLFAVYPTVVAVTDFLSVLYVFYTVLHSWINLDSARWTKHPRGLIPLGLF